MLGLQLSRSESGELSWSRRDESVIALPDELTRRSLYSWCGSLISHYPVARWLRVHCSWLKRLSSLHNLDWDSPLPEKMVLRCIDLAQKLSEHDPVHGLWYVPRNPEACTVWCDASDIAYGAVLEIDGRTVEDCSWLRKPEDARHINVVELDSAVEGISLAAEWDIREFDLKTNSKTVAGWLQQVVSNSRRVKTGGIHELLVRRRLQVIDDLIGTFGLKINVVWVPSLKNRADELTRVPKEWIAHAKSLIEPVVVATSVSVVGPVTLKEIRTKQSACPVISKVVQQLDSGELVTADSYKCVRKQLTLDDGLLMRSVKLSVAGEVLVPVIPSTLIARVVEVAHTTAGHGSWETVYQMLRCRCHFPGMASACQSHVKSCRRCSAANSSGGPVAAPTRPDIPGRPWGEVAIDVLELGADGSSQCHCVLVCVDVLTKWIEVAPVKVTPLFLS